MKATTRIFGCTSSIIALPIILMLVGLLGSCKKSTDTTDTPVSAKTMDQLVVSQDFSWATTKEVSFTIIARDNMDNPLANVRFKVYSASPDSGGVYMFSGVTDASGIWNSIQPIPSYTEAITVTNDYIGLVHEQKIAV